MVVDGAKVVIDPESKAGYLTLQGLEGRSACPPSKAAAKRYIDAGLIFATVKTLPALMNSIELVQHGFLVPFVFRGPGYSITVTPDELSRGLTPEEVQESDRAKFLAAVDADKATVAARKAADAADVAAGIHRTERKP